jgi:hypothetical protein
MKLIRKMLFLITLMLSIHSIISFNLTDLCTDSYSECKGSHSYKCTQNVCSLNQETCNEYCQFKQLKMFQSTKDLIILMPHIQTCASSFKLSRNDYCLKRLNCFKKQQKKINGAFKTFKKKIDCKCETKMHSFKCGDYCTLDEQFCELLNKKIQNENIKFNKKDIHMCITYRNIF